jgi:hypothetical protein
MKPARGEHLRRQLAGARLLDHVADLGVVVRAVDTTRLDDHDRRATGDPVLGELVCERLGALILTRELAVATEALLDDPL